MAFRCIVLLILLFSSIALPVCLADPIYDGIDSQDPRLIRRAEANKRISNAAIAKIASCPSDKPAEGLEGLALSVSPCAQADLKLRSCEQKQRYIKRSIVDDCVYAILLVECGKEYPGFVGDPLVRFECSDIVGTNPIEFI